MLSFFFLFLIDRLYDCESYDDHPKYPPSSSSVERAFSDLKIKSSSSDSEYSDIESSSSRIKSYQASVRQLAYQVLQAVVKVIIIIFLNFNMLLK